MVTLIGVMAYIDSPWPPWEVAGFIYPTIDDSELDDMRWFEHGDQRRERALFKLPALNPDMSLFIVPRSLQLAQRVL